MTEKVKGEEERKKCIRQGLTLSLRLEDSRAITAHTSLQPLPPRLKSSSFCSYRMDMDKNFGRPRQEDHSTSEIQDQSGQHSDALSLRKRKKLTRHSDIPGDSRRRSHAGRRRDSFGRRGSFAGTQRGASRCGVCGTDGNGLGWSHPHKENSNWKR
ncbi:hypothetical protein AAY473_015402 [Plecturocebus cupreus]